MTIIAATAFGRAKRAFGLLQKIKSHRPSAELRRRAAKKAGHGKPECGTKKRDRLSEIRDIDVDAQIHGGNLARLRHRARPNITDRRRREGTRPCRQRAR
jgi:hypothetical protein